MKAAHTSKSGRNAAQPAAPLKTLVIATDFSDHAAAALKWATQIATAHGARMIIVHAIDSELPALPEAQGAIAEHVQRKLAAIEKGLKAAKTPVQAEYDLGRPWDVIAKVAKKANADMIIVGAHGQSKLSERVLGTVADRLVRSTSIPVVVHPGDESKAGRGIQTVLAATDFSEESNLAISAAVRLMHGTGKSSRLVLFHAVPLLISYTDFNSAATTPQYWDEMEKTASRQLESLAATLRSDHLNVEIKTIRGYPADSILKEADAIKADLIAIGTVGRTGFNRFFMGSVAERVLHAAPCPVLTVRRETNATP